MSDVRGVTGCPDGGTCHHGCFKGCWRVAYCGPLSGMFPGDWWPADVIEASGRPEHDDDLTTAIVATANPTKTETTKPKGTEAESDG